MAGIALERPKKPLDLGNGLVCASFDEEGAWLSLGAVHSRHGFVELNALPRFDERRRGDPAAVRAYRALMTESSYAFLRVDTPGWHMTVSCRAPAGRRELEQRLLLTVDAPHPSAPVLRFRGMLDRPAFAEITEVSPLAPTGAETTLAARGDTLQISANTLPALAEIRVAGSSRSWQIAADGATLVLGAGHGSERELEVLIRCSLCEPPE